VSTKAIYSPTRKGKPSGLRGHWNDEIRANAGPVIPHREGRRTEKQRWQAEARAELVSAA
jgi:hypothetical protein